MIAVTQVVDCVDSLCYDSLLDSACIVTTDPHGSIFLDDRDYRCSPI